MEHLRKLWVPRNSIDLANRFPSLLDKLDVESDFFSVFKQVDRLRDYQTEDRFARETALQGCSRHLLGRKLSAVLLEVSDRLHSVPDALTARRVRHLEVLVGQLVASRFLCEVVGVEPVELPQATAQADQLLLGHIAGSALATGASLKKVQ